MVKILIVHFCIIKEAPNAVKKLCSFALNVTSHHCVAFGLLHPYTIHTLENTETDSCTHTQKHTYSHTHYNILRVSTLTKTDELFIPNDICEMDALRYMRPVLLEGVSD